MSDPVDDWLNELNEESKRDTEKRYPPEKVEEMLDEIKKKGGKS